MHGNVVRLRSGTTYRTPHPQLFVATHHGGLGGLVLWRNVQGITGGHVRQTTAPYYFLHGGVHVDLALVGGGGSQRGGVRVSW